MNESIDQFRQDLANSNPDLSDTSDFNEIEKQVVDAYRELWRLSSVIAEHAQTCETSAEYICLATKNGQVLAASIPSLLSV